MDADWITSPSGRRVLVHWADARPAWLWSGDGQRLLWRNHAARLFGARIKKSGLRLAPEATPIKGQVARLIRLGQPGRSSLSRIQFLAGDKPVSTTCTCTPLELPGGQTGLLIVGVDPIGADLLAADTEPDPRPAAILPAGMGYLAIDERGRLAGGSPAARELAAGPLLAGDKQAAGPGETLDIAAGTGTVRLSRVRAGPGSESLFLLPGVEAEAEPVPEAGPRQQPEEAASDEPLLPLGLPPVAGTEVEREGAAPDTESEVWVPPAEIPQPPSPSLTSLFDRLANDADLYAGLEPPRETEPPEPVDTIGALIAFDETDEPAREEAIEAPARDRRDDLAGQAAAQEPPPMQDPGATEPTPVEPDSGEAPADAAPPAAEPIALYRVTAHAIETAVEMAEPAVAAPVEQMPDAGREPDAAPEPGPADAPAHPDAETVERVSRYNFDELSRILTDRVGAEAPPPAPVRPPATFQHEGQLVSLNGETLILNRLPLGILVFRDEQILFANRAITEMIGYGSVEDLRQAGLAAVFPAAGAQEAGPVNHLVQRNGTLLPVTARLQSISWQGRPALMLSASATEVRTGHETAVRAFAELLAGERSDGFIELTRAGVVSMASPRAVLAFNRHEHQVSGRPLSTLIEPADTRTLQQFLERPARFAEAARPAVTLRGAEAGTEILLFAQGQAGVITGYFGLVRRQEPRALPAPAAIEIEPALLGRLSRGVRRPLNTIIGFADIIRSAAFGAVGSERYAEYARDIRTAGHEIAALVDELDDYARLRDGRYAPRLTEIDLQALLETCLARVRSQATAARVLVRSAISAQLPTVRADRASLGQAILNLLASAIGQTPPGGSVILSAQTLDGGGISVNVRDTGSAEADPGERFVVFRDVPPRDGDPALPAVRSSVGLALTRQLAAVNAIDLTVDPAGGPGTIFSLTIPAGAVVTLKATAGD